MQAACISHIVISFILMIVGLVVLVYGILKLIQKVDVKIDADIVSVSDVFVAKQGTYEIGEEKYKYGKSGALEYRRCADIKLTENGRTVNIAGPCDTQCPGRGKTYLFAESKDGITNCRDDNWNVCQVKIKYEYEGQTFNQTLDIDHDNTCELKFRKGEKMKIRHSTNTKQAIPNSAYTNPETIGYVLSAVGLLILLYNIGTFVKASSKTGCQAIIETEKASAASGSSGFATGMVLGSLLSSGGSDFSSAEMSRVVE